MCVCVEEWGQSVCVCGGGGGGGGGKWLLQRLYIIIYIQTLAKQATITIDSRGTSSTTCTILSML